jgi:hypothetical protein
VTYQRLIHAPPIRIELPLVYNFTANGDDIGRCAGTTLTSRCDSTVHDHAEIFIAICSVFAGLDICITVEPFDRLLKWRELGYHNSFHALILIRVEHLGWSVSYEHIDILGASCQ